MGQLMARPPGIQGTPDRYVQKSQDGPEPIRPFCRGGWEASRGPGQEPRGSELCFRTGGGARRQLGRRTSTRRGKPAAYSCSSVCHSCSELLLDLTLQNLTLNSLARPLRPQPRIASRARSRTSPDRELNDRCIRRREVASCVRAPHGEATIHRIAHAQK